MTDDRRVTLLGETATVPEDPRFLTGPDGDHDFRISLGGVTHCCSLGPDYFNGVLAIAACEAAIVHFEGKVQAMLAECPALNKPQHSDDMGPLDDKYKEFCDNAEIWRRILKGTA